MCTEENQELPEESEHGGDKSTNKNKKRKELLDNVFINLTGLIFKEQRTS